ncbi:hypothetical protein [Siphonobacter sp. BAB-5385]|uniref:hypothetical protein n=1 Tax=Siphonobacter sp. BAB-5385 TaxID=1864822 RepID=UPI0034E98603
MKKVVTFGEVMLRLSTPGFARFVQTTSLNVNFGGGEATWQPLWRTSAFQPVT